MTSPDPSTRGRAVLELPWQKPPLSLNDRRNRWGHARAVKEVRSAVAWLARQAHLGPYVRVQVELHYQPRTRHKRDSDNLAATYKPCADGLVDAGVVPDDNDEVVRRVWPEIHPAVKGEPGRMWLVVTALDDEEAA